MLPISVCIIAQNEEKKIERCLSSLKPYGFEIVVVDTGSSDKTKQLAACYTDKIYDFEWIQDFSAARNFSLTMASNDWILMIDCDEAIVQIDIEELLYFQENLSHAAGSVSRENLMGTPGNTHTSIDRTERFFSRRLFHYTGRIHEQLTPMLGTEMENYLLNATFLHDGYFMDETERVLKATRNLTLLHSQLQDEPDNPYLYYQLGKGYEMIFDYTAACEWFQKGLDFALDPSLAYVEALVISYGQSLLHTGQNEKALELEANTDDFNASADFSYLMGLIYKCNEKYPEAFLSFERALAFEYSNQEGITDYLSLYEMGGIRLLSGDLEEAKRLLALCGEYQPAKDVLSLLNMPI